MQVTVRFCSIPAQFRGKNPRGGKEPPTALPHPPTTRGELRLDDYKCRKVTIHVQTSMFSPGFEPFLYGTAFSVANHYTA
ncbi:hypothetical protein TNCV_351751 [Trichonephila clavipes]|nr:hypothetical protein TNCV_351751 [Trichonephila clavipes]